MRAVFKALYDRRTEDLRAGHNRLSGLLAALSGNWQSLLPPVGSLPEAERAALAEQFEQLLVRAKAWKAQLDRYFAAGWVSPCPPVYDPLYCLHNDVLLPLYNDPATGVAPALNGYRRLGGWAVQETMLQAPVFSRVLPRFLRAEEPPALSPEEVMRIVEQKRRKAADTLVTAPPAPPQPEPRLGDPTLEGFAANNLIFLLDVSSSMDRPEKLPLLQQSIEKLLPLMRAEDFVSLIVYSGEARVVLPPTSAARKETVLEAVRNLRGAGRSAVDKGLQLAYETADTFFVPGGNNRIVLATDGEFEVDNRMRRAIRKGGEREIALSVYFFGPVEYPSAKIQLEELARLGKGRYCHVKADNAEQILLLEAQAVRKK
jgi:Ca-activated chloride channel family protein